MSQETLETDVLIVGAGPAGLSTAIRLAQLANAANTQISILVLEKAAQVGDHILSGCILEPRALQELLPEQYTELLNKLGTPVTKDNFYLLSKKRNFTLPTPSPLQNKGNYIISLGALCRELAKIAENLGVELCCGFAASKPIIDPEKGLIGVYSNAIGLNRAGKAKANYQAPVKILAKHTVLAEGCRGSLSEALIAHFNLRTPEQKQSYGIGFKEVWEITSEVHQEGTVVHTLGWPLNKHTYGGGFAYHIKNNRLYCGFVIGLDYQNPSLDPYAEFQNFKTHPLIAKLLKNGRCLGYGARALNEAGFQGLPSLSFPGGLLVGCAAGFLNVAKLKGTHTAMKSGMLAAESIFKSSENYTAAIKASWIWDELYQARNLRPVFNFGLFAGLAYAALDHYLFNGKAPWTLGYHKADHERLKPLANVTPIIYPKQDGILSFDKLTSVSRSNTHHEEDQPCHLQLKNPALAIEHNWKLYGSPEQFYCPAGVYELVFTGTDPIPKLQINAANCLHCKVCDIKDPLQNIHWTPPEGGGGPSYGEL